MNPEILIPFLIYIILLILIIIYTSRPAISTVDGFYLGGRKINPFLIAISSVISARGSWLLLGITTQAYIMGLSAIWLIVGFITSEFLLFLFLAPAIQRFSKKNNCTSIADILVSRFPDKNNSIRIIVSMVLLFFLVSLISSQMVGVSRAFYAFFGLSLANGVIITGVFILLVSFFGGFKTLSYTDVLHAIIILAIIIGLPSVILIRAEGFGNIRTDILYSSPEFFSVKALSVGAFLGFLSIGLGSLGNPHILAKYMSVRVHSFFPAAAIFSAFLNILMATGALFIGIFARFHFPLNDSVPGADAQYAFIGLASDILSPVLTGVVFTSIFAAAMSAGGAQILVSANTLVIDLFAKTFNREKKIPQKNLIFYSRIAIVVLGYIAILTGLTINIDIYGFVLFSWAGLGASIGPAFLLSFSWKGTTGWGVIAGIITGALTVVFWHSNPFLSGIIYELFPGFLISLLSIWIVSRTDKNRALRKYNRTERYTDIYKRMPGTIE